MIPSRALRSSVKQTPLDPFHLFFRLLTSIRFAVWLLVILTLAALAGVVLPQMPPGVVGSDQLRAAWLADKGAQYGVFQGPLERLGFFEVFRSVWFNGLVLLLLLAVAVCTVSRFGPIWRNFRRPPRRVNDRYFETAKHRADFAGATEEQLRQTLSRRRYKVQRYEEAGAVYLFADRFAWSQLATFASHLSLLMFLAGALVTWQVGWSENVLIAEGTSKPVGAVGSDDLIQVKVLDFVRERDELGRDLQYYTQLAVFKNGEEVARGKSTVNDPLQWNGYKFHQAAFLEDGVALEVREGDGGRVLYSEVINLPDKLALPVVKVADSSGSVLYEDVVLQTIFPGEDMTGGILALPQGSFYVGLRLASGDTGGPPYELMVLPPSGEIIEIPFGAEKAAGDLKFTFSSLSASLYRSISGRPAPDGSDLLVQMARTVDDQPIMSLQTPDGEFARLGEGESATYQDRTYSFLGARDYSGIIVRKDPGATFIWVATGLMMFGLVLTFYLPRRRLWAKVTPGRTYLAAVGARGLRLREELYDIGAAAGSAEAATRRRQTGQQAEDNYDGSW